MLKIKSIIILVISILLLCGCTIRLAYDYYEYEDFDGNKGIAKECWTGNFDGIFKCDLKDGTRIAVKSYKGVYEDK